MTSFTSGTRPPAQQPANGHQARGRAFAWLLLITIGFAAVVILYTARTTHHLTREVQAQCRFDADLGGVPVSINPATHEASVLGVKIVSDSRVAWRLAGCPGTLPRATPSFLRWAKFYHLPTG